MGPTPNISYTHSADFSYIDAALRARWEPYCLLQRDFRQLVPKKFEDYAEYRAKELHRMRELNPGLSVQSLIEFVDGQIRANCEPGIQIHSTFSDRIMSEYVTVAFLAHALCEATINAILAIGLSRCGASDVFQLIERSEIKEKWLIGPKAFQPGYEFPKGQALYETLNHLVRQRNGYVHHKIELSMNGEKKLEGSVLDRSPWNVKLTWIGRFFSLPYDLAHYARQNIKTVPIMLLFDSRPIERFRGHAVA